MAVGTVAYAAPEQLLGLTLDGRADQYSLAATAFELLTGSHLYLDLNPAVVISQHVSAPPPEIADRKPELSGLGPILSKALAKSPDDRYETCTDFANALARHLDVSVDGIGADDATLDAMAVARSRASKAPKGRRPLVITAAVVAALVVIAGVVAAVFLAGHHQNAAAPPPPAMPAVPVVLVGADCEVLGAAGVSETGQKAYCARLPSTGDLMWSLVSGVVVPAPTVTKGPNDPSYPRGIEQQVDVCVQQTGRTRLECRDDVRRGNITGPP
jgi:serine/threonine protein kinase, bacterial